MVRLQIRSPPIAGLMMGRVLMWAMVISDSVNLHSFADPPPSTIHYPSSARPLFAFSQYLPIYQNCIIIISAGTNRGVKDCDYRIQCQDSNFPQRIQLFIFTALLGRNNTAKNDPWTSEIYFNTRGGPSLHLPIKLGCLADTLKHTKLVFYRSLMSLEQNPSLIHGH